jgi:hypothetical protein
MSSDSGGAASSATIGDTTARFSAVAASARADAYARARARARALTRYA